jgi:hypothetical protein
VNRPDVPGQRQAAMGLAIAQENGKRLNKVLPANAVSKQTRNVEKTKEQLC